MPKIVHSDSTNNRVNPYITKGISRTLLTPCRQVGLSRKKKTPNSSKSSSDVSANDLSGSIVLNTTSVTSKESSSDFPNLSQETKSQLKQDKKSAKVRAKKSVSKCLMVEDTDDGSVVLSKTSDCCKKSVDESVEDSDKITSRKSGLKHVLTDDEDDTGFVGFKTEDSSEQASTNKIKSCNKLKMKKTGLKHAIIDDDDDISLVSLKDNSNKPKTKKSVSKRLIISDDEDEDDVNLASLKKNDSTEKLPYKDIISDPDFDICHVPVLKPRDNLRQYENKKKKTVLTEIQNGLEEKPAPKLELKDENIKKPEKKLKMKRLLSMKKSSEENHQSDLEDCMTQDCTVVLSPLESKLEPESIDVNDLHKLEIEVQQKRKLLGELQQAEIYRKLHDVDKLQELTATWKNGCIGALNDLLPHLQAHTTIDMATLLSNLRVPEKLITLSQSGDLI